MNQSKTSNINVKIRPQQEHNLWPFLVRADLWLEEIIFTVTNKHLEEFEESNQIIIIHDCAKLYTEFLKIYLKQKYGSEELDELSLINLNFIPAIQKRDAFSKLWETKLAFKQFVRENK